MSTNFNLEAVNLLRFLSVDMVQNANSGHPGLPLGVASTAYVLWTRHLKHSPRNPEWVDRDRFVLSPGHGSALLYSLLFTTGYDLSLDDIKQFRQWGSRAPGHPERSHTPGVEVTTGPLGQGLANAVGLAIGEAHLAARYNRPGHEVVNHRTWAIVSDGDLMEGVAAEAASLAGQLRLGKLVCIYDDNKVTLSAGTDISFSEDRQARFDAYGWHTLRVDDGNDLEALDAAMTAAAAHTDRPTLIVVRNHLGFGSPKQDSFKAHGSPLGVDAVKATKAQLGWPLEPAFFLPDDALAHLRKVADVGDEAEAKWQAQFSAFSRAHGDVATELMGRFDHRLPDGWDADIPTFAPTDKPVATRVAGGQVMNAIAKGLPALIGGSADLDPSTFTALKGLGDLNRPPEGTVNEEGSLGGGWSYAGRNIHFGVREHAMGAIVNGLAAHGGFLPYGSTFLIFSDYMRPAIRLAALMGLHVVHVFTHDSLALGEDGPTHQPVEQLASLRAIPGLTLIRPADANETAVAWRVAVETAGRPVLLALSRQELPILDRTRFAPAEGLRKGAYVLWDSSNSPPALILIATGSEVALIVKAAEQLEEQGISVRCVSMPSWELFEAQPEAYRNEVLPPKIGRRVVVELGSRMGWDRYSGPQGHVISVEGFGASAPAEVLQEKYGFTVEHVVASALDLFK